MNGTLGSLAEAESPDPPATKSIDMRRRHSQIGFANSLHFVTTATSVRGLWFTDGAFCQQILESFEFHRGSNGIVCLGYVLMPDHFHALLYQAEEGTAVSDCIAGFKKFTSRFLKPKNYLDSTLWSLHFDDVPIPGFKAALKRIEYLHENPVRAGLVGKVDDFRWSSARFYETGEEGVVEIRKPWE